LYAGLVPFTRGSPGCGKSEIHKSIAKELNLQIIDHRAAGSDPTDFSGLPGYRDGKAYFAPFEELFPLAGAKLPEGKQGWLLLLDEVNSASKMVVAAMYKLILDRMVGQHKLHENVLIACAGNLDTDRAITNPMGTAMQSRMIHLHLDIVGHEQEWIEDVALPQNYDKRIIAYLSRYPNKLMNFRPDHNDSTFCSPRTWSFMNKLIQGQEVTESRSALYAGTITSGVAVDFVQFTKVFQNLITIKEILSNPKECKLPNDLNEKWATITYIIENLDSTNIEPLTVYVDRFSLDFKLLFYRSIPIRQEKLMKHPAYRQALLELSRYLHNN